ncbi:MAG: DNA methylase [Lachnospiraceae bacterium]|nr:DNA methylase [Lachnospiraceae bacterium]
MPRSAEVKLSTAAEKRSYIAIDLKSFYASVECVERGLDPLTTHLVVADESRTEKTICLAVSPALKAHGIPGRARLFEVNQRVEEVNRARLHDLRGKAFTGSARDAKDLSAHPDYSLAFIAAKPRMSLYMDYGARIYQVYLRYVAPEDVHVYSIDEVLIDVTAYLNTYKLTARQLCAKMIREVYEETGITAAGGVGTNLYLCKVAMDILAKHMPPDEMGVRIAELDEISYRKVLWTHRPLSDFWRVGRATEKKLAGYGIYTMGDLARASLENEDLLYRLFGVNAELLIDHAWGFESATMAAIRAYKPESESVGTAQVLSCPYDFDKGKLIVREMTDQLLLNLLEKHLVTDQIALTIHYDRENMNNPEVLKRYQGKIRKDFYGRETPMYAHGTAHAGCFTSSSRLFTEAMMKLYDQIVDPMLTIRRVGLTALHVMSEKDAEDRAEKDRRFEQLELFTDYDKEDEDRRKKDEKLSREKRAQQAVLEIRKKFGNGAIVRGMNLEEGATGRDRNGQIGGHKA